jgi:hypothetical protein
MKKQTKPQPRSTSETISGVIIILVLILVNIMTVQLLTTDYALLFVASFALLIIAIVLTIRGRKGSIYTFFSHGGDWFWPF